MDFFWKLHYTSSTSSSEEEEEKTICMIVLPQLRKNSHDKFGWASMKHYRSFKLSMSYSNYSIVSGNIHGQYGRFVQRPVTVEDVVFRGTVEISVRHRLHFLTNFHFASCNKLSAALVSFIDLSREKGCWRFLNLRENTSQNKCARFNYTHTRVFYTRALSVFKTTQVYIRTLGGKREEITYRGYS